MEKASKVAVWENFEWAAGWYFDHSGRVKAMAFIAESRLDKNAAIREAFYEGVARNSVQVNTLI